MENFKLYTKEKIDHLISVRSGETKFGEKIQFIPSLEELKTSEAKYVLFGIPEDIGVRGNYGKAGTSSAWKAFLSAFLNIQKNQFNRPENCILLGELDCDHLMETAENIPLNQPEKLGKLVSELDEALSKIIARIISEEKVPIIIGGGHNNAYGNIKGTCAALKTPINVLNIDAHTDLRNTGYRHSGNGFSQAIQEKLLEKYFIFGLHENYTPAKIFEKINTSENTRFQLFDEMLVLSGKEKCNELESACDFLDKEFGLEIDCDSIAYFPSSAIGPSGFSMDEMRNFVRILSSYNPHYLHVCEAVAEKGSLTGKALAYLVSDFMKRKSTEN